jgi:hypothetical protein
MGAVDAPTVRAFAWRAAQAEIDALSAGWFCLEPAALFERELDALGNEIQPRLHAVFHEPSAAVRYVTDVIAARSWPTANFGSSIASDSAP